MWTHFFPLGDLFRLCPSSDIAENSVNIFIIFQKLPQYSEQIFSSNQYF